MSRRPPNPTGKGGFKPGQSGNPGGRAKKAIGNLGAEARKYAGLALSTLVELCEGKHKAMPRDRLAAANALLDRGFGRPTQALDLVMVGRKLSELSLEELTALNASLVSAAGVAVTESAEATEQPAQDPEGALH
jgi:hypothetical protein